jgi:hypothetical protein
LGPRPHVRALVGCPAPGVSRFGVGGRRRPPARPPPEFDALRKQTHLDVDAAIEASPERLWVRPGRARD